MDSDPPPPLASSSHQGKSDNNPQSHAILHLKPSIRQTVVKTITTTTIHYAPIALPRPKSPILNGDYATDRHSLPLQLAEKRRKEALLRGGRVKTASSDPEEEIAQDDGDLRRFQLEFGGSTGGDTDSASNREPIKATYSLDGHTDATVASISTLSQASIAPDRQGKGKARHVSVDHSTHSGLALQEIPELKRKRCASQLSESAQPGPSSSTVSTVSDTSSSVPETSHPPRKKTRTSSTTFVPPLTRARASSGTTTQSLLSQAATSSDSDAEASIMKASRTAKGKGRAIPSEIVLPSPTLSPGLPADESREEEIIQAVNTERQLVSYNTRVPTPESQELVSTTSVEQVLEDDEKNNNDEQQLTCLAEGHTLSTLISLPSLIDNYSTLSPKLQLNILYQLLRQSSTPILQRINQIIQPALKRDFISDLPIELSLQIMFYLDHKTIINCLTVCRNWKRFIDSQGKIWLNLLKEKNLWIGNGEENAREEIGFDNAGEDDERESGIGTGNKKTWTAFETIENEEASFWEGVGTTKGAFRSSKVGRKLHRQQQQQAASSRERRRRKSTSKSRSREREADSVENGEGSRQAEEQKKIREDNRELDVKDLLSVSDWKAALFLKRWKEGIWDEGFDMEEAARPTAEKLAALNTIRSTSPASGAGMSTAPAQPHPRLRRANTRPRIGEDGALRRTTSPPSAAQSLPSKADYVHPLKLIYKKRTAVRSHWFSQEPVETSIKRITFQSSQTSVITNLQFDNEKIITSSDDPIIDIYDTLNGELKMRLKGHDGGVWALQYIGNVLVSGSTDRTVRVWDLETGNCTHVFYGHTSTVRCLQIVEPVNGKSSYDFPECDIRY